MTKDVERLKAVRGAHRGVVTKLTGQAEEIFDNEFMTSDHYERLFVIHQQLSTKLETLNDYDQRILTVCDVINIENEIEESQQTVEEVMECKRKIDVKLKQRPSESNDNKNESNTNQATSHPASRAFRFKRGSARRVATSPRSKLPKLSLPKFRGDVTKWKTFQRSINSTISNQARAIAGLTLTASNYDSAVEILKDRFGKTQQIISAHMDELLKVSTCSNDRPAQLRFVYCQICVHTRSLASLGVTADQYGSLLIPIIMSKLPPEIRLQIARNTKDSVWKIEDLLNVIKIEVEAREASEMTKTSDGRKPQTNSRNRSQQNPSAASLVSQDGASFTIKGAFCQNEHVLLSRMCRNEETFWRRTIDALIAYEEVIK